MNLPALIAPIVDDMKAVDAVIRERLNSDVVLIRTIGDYIIGAGGKRMRPAMVLMVARAGVSRDAPPVAGRRGGVHPYRDAAA